MTRPVQPVRPNFYKGIRIIPQNSLLSGPLRERKLLGTISLRFLDSHRLLVFAIASGLWVLLIYGRTLTAPFVYDDLDQIVNNKFLNSFHSLVTHFLSRSVQFSTEFRGSQSGSTYRPIYWVDLFAERHLWGIFLPRYFHLTNILLHWANGIALFGLLSRLSIPTRIAAISSLVWLMLPINSEVVSWISARSYLFCTLFILLALWTAVKYVTSPTNVGLLCYFWLSVAALLSNECGIVLVLLIFLLPTMVKASVRALIPLCLLSAFSGILYVSLRFLTGSHRGQGAPQFYTCGVIFSKYLLWLIFPFQMSIERSTSLPKEELSLVSVCALAFLLAYFGLAFLLLKYRRLVGFGLLWTGICLLPYCGFIYIYQGMAERFEYLASIGVVLALMSALVGLKSNRAIATVGLLVWLSWGMWRLQIRITDWGDPVLLYQHSLEATPNSKTLSLDLASTLVGDGVAADNRGDNGAAEALFEKAITVAPLNNAAYNDLGALYVRMRRIDAAIQCFTKSTELNPNDPTPFFNLGILFRQLRQDDVALPFFKKALELKPGDPETISEIAQLRVR